MKHFELNFSFINRKSNYRHFGKALIRTLIIGCVYLKMLTQEGVLLEGELLTRRDLQNSIKNNQHSILIQIDFKFRVTSDKCKYTQKH